MDTAATDLEDLEIKLLLEAIYQRYGYDFRNYAFPSIRRRILQRLDRSNIKSISELMHQVLHDEAIFELLLDDFSINTTEMYRDPSFYKAIRTKVAPILSSYPYIKIWHAGCSSGEEVYSMAILLKEAGLFNKVRIYATDFNERILAKAKAGVFPIDGIKQYTANYQKSGGCESFSDYYEAQYDLVIVKKEIREKIIFSDHNLVTDSAFGEFHVIFCRNVLIYFNRDLQNRALGVFDDSLMRNGFLCLGAKETIKFSSVQKDFLSFVEKEKIYRKKLSSV